MLNQPSSLKLFLCVVVAFAALFPYGFCAECGSSNTPTVRQTQVGFGNPPKFQVDIQNKCPMCPVIDIHLKCGSFSQDLVKPRLLKLVRYNDCVVNAGLPLSPFEIISFNYSHHKFLMSPTTWFFQCE